MSSHPTGFRYSPLTTSRQQPQQQQQPSINVAQIEPQTNLGHLVQSLQHQPMQAISKSQLHANKQSQPPPPQYSSATTSLSGSETDISTSTENLSMEQRYVLRHTPRVEPQGQENYQENMSSGNENQARFVADQRFSNASTDSTRYASSSKSISSDPRSAVLNQQQQQQVAAQNNAGGANSNRNSLKESISNRSSMDVSTCSYNTLIIHNDDSMYSIGNRDYSSPPPLAKKERPRSYGEPLFPKQGMQEITEIPDDYLNQSQVLKHLAKEIKQPGGNRRSNTRDSGMSDNTDPKEQQKYNQWVIEENEQNIKLKSKSQPDLTKLIEVDVEAMEALTKENEKLKSQLHAYYKKVAKTQKLEDEVANIYRVHEELVQSCERREKLERAARMRLQSDLQRVQELNRALKDQVDIFQSQLLAPSEHQILIAQLFTQNKELSAAKERQEIELSAQRATLQEQRNHIGILDNALTNAQHNIRRLEEELRKKQMHLDRVNQLMAAKQNERKMRMDYEAELSKDSNRSGSSTASEPKWQLQEKNNQMLRLESEQRHLEEQALRQNVSKMASLEKNAQVNQETDRIIAEAKNDKLRYLEEVHSAQRKVNDLQTHLKLLESRLAEKDSLIRALQTQKICGSSFDSYNLSSDSFALNPLGYNSQTSFNASNTSFNTATNASILEQTFCGNVANTFNPPISGAYAPCSSPYNSTTSAYNQSVVNLQAIASLNGKYSPNSSNYSGNYDPSANVVGVNGGSSNGSNVNAYQQVAGAGTVSNGGGGGYEMMDRASIDEVKKQLDEQLSKRGLCCFPSLSNKKPNTPLLSDEVSVLSTNNSDAFLQKLAHIDQRDRDRRDEQRDQKTPSSSSLPPSASKHEEMILLEKQGRCSQKLRNNTTGNLAQVTQTVGQNMTDISNIGNPKRKERGSSLPPSALPRPPRNLKTQRKIEYDRLSDTDIKKRSETPPKMLPPPTPYNMKASSSLKQGEFVRSSFSPAKGGSPYPETMVYQKPAVSYSVKRSDYGTMTHNDAYQHKSQSDFSKPDYTSTKTYRRLEESPKPSKQENSSSKRSLLPSARKYSTGNTSNITRNARDSLNSSGSNNSSNMTTRSSPIHINMDNGAQSYQVHAKSPSKYITLTPPPRNAKTSMLPGPSGSTAGASLPPKPAMDNKTSRRGSSLTRNENRYRIQF